MPNTAIWSLPYPALTAAPNVPADIQSLANTLDTKLQLRIVSTTADVAVPYTNQIVFATTDLRLYRYTGSAWVAFNPVNPPACVLVDNADRSIAASTQTFIGAAVVEEQTTIGGNTMATSGTGGTSSANSPSITIREAGLYEVGLRVTWATDGTNGSGVRVAGITLNSTSPALTRATALTSVNAPIEGTNTQTEGQGVGTSIKKRFAVGDVLRPVCVASAAAFINSASTSFAVGGVTRFWVSKVKD